MPEQIVITDKTSQAEYIYQAYRHALAEVFAAVVVPSFEVEASIYQMKCGNKLAVRDFGLRHGGRSF